MLTNQRLTIHTHRCPIKCKVAIAIRRDVCPDSGPRGGRRSSVSEPPEFYRLATGGSLTLDHQPPTPISAIVASENDTFAEQTKTITTLVFKNPPAVSDPINRVTTNVGGFAFLPD